jgi:hypothetical protein
MKQRAKKAAQPTGMRVIVVAVIVAGIMIIVILIIMHVGVIIGIVVVVILVIVGIVVAVIFVIVECGRNITSRLLR